MMLPSRHLSWIANYVCEHWIYEGENQPIGLILGSERNQSVMLPISEAFVGLGAKNLFTPCDGKGEGRCLAH
jgi:hypothetical protein